MTFPPCLHFEPRSADVSGAVILDTRFRLVTTQTSAATEAETPLFYPPSGKFSPARFLPPASADVIINAWKPLCSFPLHDETEHTRKKKKKTVV